MKVTATSMYRGRGNCGGIVNVTSTNKIVSAVTLPTGKGNAAVDEQSQ